MAVIAGRLWRFCDITRPGRDPVRIVSQNCQSSAGECATMIR
ncbi:hypothetical protein AB0A63_10115 [Lentzea sp. NPDC042327]